MHNDLNTTPAILLIYDFSETTGWVPTHKVVAFTSLFRVNTRELDVDMQSPISRAITARFYIKLLSLSDYQSQHRYTSM